MRHGTPAPHKIQCNFIKLDFNQDNLYFFDENVNCNNYNERRGPRVVDTKNITTHKTGDVKRCWKAFNRLTQAIL